jgi:phage terminase large subunit-like protein
LPSFENTFKRLHLNIWTTQDVKWIGDDKWMECNLRDIDAERLKGRECWAALDLASVSDLTALVLLFPMDDGTFDILNFNWIPAENAYQRTLKYGIPFDVWIEQGYLYSTDGDVTDYEVIKNKILELSEIYDIKSLSYDRWNSSMLINELMGAGVNVTPYGQGFASMSFPAKQLERWILEKKINHGGNPSLRWQFSNVQIQTDASGNIKPNKAKSKEKIDSIVSLIMSIGDYMNDNQEPVQKTIYNDDNIKFI